MTADPLARVAAWEGSAGPMAMATLIAAEGTSSTLVGARTFVDGEGQIVGAVTIGGCVDARAVDAADRVLATGTSELVDVALGDEEAWDMGLACGGTLRLLVERVGGGAAPGDAARAYAAARDAVEAGRRMMVVSALAGSGARMALDAAGTRVGTLGSADRDTRVSALALAHEGSAPRVVRDACDGAEYFVEAFAPPVTVAVFGAGEVAVVLARIVRELGMRVVIVDARARYATRARFPDADELRVGDPGAAAAEIPHPANTLVVIVSHDYKFELPVLREVLRAPVRYIGLMSSRRRGEQLRAFLAGEGFTPEELARIQTPIGVAIGARTPAEVALSIAAELVARRAARG